MKIHFKYSEPTCCEALVQIKLKELRLPYHMTSPDAADLKEGITGEQYMQLRKELAALGIDLVGSRQTQLVERLKAVIGELVSQADHLPREKNSTYISGRLQSDYAYLASTFSEATGITIAQYIIELRIEQAKKMLLDGELSLTQISHKLHYSSVAHLSNQFKKVTGLTPSCFKQRWQRRHPVQAGGKIATLFCNCVKDSGIKWMSFAG